MGLPRRRLLQASGACAACAVLPGCSGLTFVPVHLVEQRLVFERIAFGEQRCVGLDHPRLAAPIAVCKLADGTLSAVSAMCTHKGCELRQEGVQLVCPCHGSTFTLTGEVQAKPATDNLRRFRVEHDERYIYVGA